MPCQLGELMLHLHYQNPLWNVINSPESLSDLEQQFEEIKYPDIFQLAGVENEGWEFDRMVNYRANALEIIQRSRSKRDLDGRAADFRCESCWRVSGFLPELWSCNIELRRPNNPFGTRKRLRLCQDCVEGVFLRSPELSLFNINTSKVRRGYAAPGDRNYKIFEPEESGS